MPRANSTLMAAIETEKAHLLALEASLRAAGDKELASAVNRARAELIDSSVNGAQNTFGVDHSAVRR